MRGEWFYTGDRYIKTPDGHFVYQGRADDMIKVGGLWVAPADVEACLIRHPAVSEAAVIGVTLDDVSRVKAFVICARSPPSPTPWPTSCGSGARSTCAATSTRTWSSSSSDFPRTVTGKIQRFKLREAEAKRAVQPA